MARKRVLVVTKSLVQIALIREALSREYHLFEAADADAAVALLGVSDFDAVVLDLKLDGPDGERVIDWILANKPSVEARTMILTGDLLSDEVRRIRAKADVPLMSIPFSLAELVRYVAWLCRV